MKKYKAKTGKLTVTLGCIAVLSAAGLGGCGMADAGNKTESERQVTETETQGVYGPETEIPGANVPEAESQKEETETGIELLPGKNDGLRKVTSANGGEAYFGSHTTVILDGETIDIKDRDDSVNAIYDIKAVDGYWIVEGHISPNVGYYGFYNTETQQWDKEFFGALLTWYGADEAEDGIPFSMDTVVYAFWNGLYDGNGTLLGTIELDEDACEYIHKLKWASTGVEVYILNAALEERMVMVSSIANSALPESESHSVENGPILNNSSITIGDLSLSLSESKQDIIAKLETAGLNYSEHQPDYPDEVKYDSYYNVAEGCIQIYFLNDSCVRIRLINYESSPSPRVQTAQELRTLNTYTQMIELYGDDFETHTYSYKGIYTIYRYSIGDFIYEFGIPGEDAEKIYNIDIYFPCQSPIYKYGEEIPETT